MRSIRAQLILVFLLVILVPSSLITYLMYSQSIEQLDKGLGDAQVSKLSKAATLIDQSLSDMSLLLWQLADSDEFIANVQQIQPGLNDPYAKNAASIMRASQAFYSRRIETIYLYLYEPRQIITSYANTRIIEVRDERYYDWIVKHSLRDGQAQSTPWFSSPGVPSPSLTESNGRSVIKKQRVSAPDGQPIGELAMLISGMTLRSAYLDTLRDASGEIILMTDPDSRPIASIGMDVPKFRAYASEPFLASINAGAAQGTFRAIAFGQQMQVSYLRSRQSGFVYLSLMPVEQYTRSMMAASMQGLLVGLVAAAAAVLVSIGYSMRFSRPIEMLRAAMNRAATGDLTVRADYRRTDDFSQITDGFNHMIGRIQQLMQDLKTEELLLKEAELRNLQAQVNPHFLYNTLETIHWMAGLNRTKEVKELSMSLASFYRATLSQGRKTVTARESFDMIREYLAILTARYGERFTATYDEPPELDNEQVLHLVLQPLVENAIQHSIERVAYHVNLYIGIREDGGDLIMTVHDDGAGIDGETLARIRATLDDETQSPEGFALQNVHRRIRLMYGDRYGLEIESEQGNYTRVSARMKKLTGETNV